MEISEFVSIYLLYKPKQLTVIIHELTTAAAPVMFHFSPNFWSVCTYRAKVSKDNVCGSTALQPSLPPDEARVCRDEGTVLLDGASAAALLECARFLSCIKYQAKYIWKFWIRRTRESFVMHCTCTLGTAYPTHTNFSFPTGNFRCLSKYAPRTCV